MGDLWAFGGFKFQIFSPLYIIIVLPEHHAPKQMAAIISTSRAGMVQPLMKAHLL